MGTMYSTTPSVLRHSSEEALPPKHPAIQHVFNILMQLQHKDKMYLKAAEYEIKK